MSTQAAPAPAATPRPAAAPAPAPELPEKWALGDGYYYKHNVIKRRNGTDETLWVMGCNEQIIDALDKYFEPRSSDVILCTFPKSGTTWVQEILTRLLEASDADDVATKPQAVPVPADEADGSIPKKTAVEAGKPSVGVFIGLDRNDRVKWLESVVSVLGFVPCLKQLRAMKKRRAFKTHLPVPALRKRFVPGVKLILVTRNPKDLCVSMWHHTRAKNFLYDGPFEHFAKELFLKGRVESGDWFKFVRESHAAATKGPNGERAFDFINPDDVLLLNYEVMCRTPGTALVSSIAEFLNIDVSAETVSAIAEASTFNSMAKSEMQHGCRLPGWPKRKLPGATDEGSIETFSARHCRKGGVGGWRDYFKDPELNAHFDSVVEENIKGTGIVVDFGEPTTSGQTSGEAATAAK